MIKIVPNNIPKIINKWQAIADKLNVKDSYNWCICMEQVHMHFRDFDTHNYILPIIAHILSNLIDNDIQIRYNYDTGIIRKYKVENLDTDLDYEEYIELNQVKTKYEVTSDKDLYNVIIDDIISKCAGRVFLPLNFIQSAKKDGDNLIVKCKFAFI